MFPQLIYFARKGKYANLVQPEISRDFIYVSDVVSAFITLAAQMNNNLYGESFNIGTAIKTTIGELAQKVGDVFGIHGSPDFGSMENRNWDLNDWYADINKAKNILKWEPFVLLSDGISLVEKWQNEVDFDKAYWNYTINLK